MTPERDLELTNWVLDQDGGGGRGSADTEHHIFERDGAVWMFYPKADGTLGEVPLMRAFMAWDSLVTRDEWEYVDRMARELIRAGDIAHPKVIA